MTKLETVSNETDSLEGTTNYIYDINDRLIRESNGSDSKEYHYDLNGNRIETTVNGQRVTSWFWNSRDQLVAVDNDGDGDIDVRQAYDFRGELVELTDELGTRRFLVDSNRTFSQVLEESTNGVVVVDFTYGLTRISQRKQGELLFFHIDPQQTVRQVSNARGKSSLLMRTTHSAD